MTELLAPDEPSPVRVLRENPARRVRWQGRFTRVLVDEFQDIEPAQELMVRIVAAPQAL